MQGVRFNARSRNAPAKCHERTSLRDQVAAPVALTSCSTAKAPSSEKLESENAGMSFHKSPNNESDPLDTEILERAFDATRDAIKSSCQHFEAETDEELEAALRRDLIEIARANGVNDPDTLKEIWLASMPPSQARRGDPSD